MRSYFDMHHRYITMSYIGVIMRVEGLPQSVGMEERVTRIIIEHQGRNKPLGYKSLSVV